MLRSFGSGGGVWSEDSDGAGVGLAFLLAGANGTTAEMRGPNRLGKGRYNEGTLKLNGSYGS